MTTNKNPMLGAVRKFANRNGDERFVVLADGSEARIVPVPASLVDDVSAAYKNPPVPMIMNEDKGRQEENPFDREYLRQLEQVNHDRGSAVIDTLVLMGVELVNGVPPQDQWIPKLKFMEKRGLIILDGYNLDDPMDVEFLYKRYVAVDATVIEQVTRFSGISPEAVRQAEESFPGS